MFSCLRVSIRAARRSCKDEYVIVLAMKYMVFSALDETAKYFSFVFEMVEMVCRMERR